MGYLEIERKFLVDMNKVPYDFSVLDNKKIEQGYILHDPEIRVRGVTDETYYMTIKSTTADPMVRNEVELKISKEAYLKLMERNDVYKINKTRYSVVENNNKYEIDVYGGRLAGLTCLEVEFNTKEEADSFLPPSWVKKEVTNDIRYRNGFLAKNDIPQE